MIYLSQLLGNPVYDCDGEKVGQVNDLGIATGEIFPRITSLAITGPGKTPFMISWRKYVDTFNEQEVRLKVVSTDIRFSYLQPDEVLIARDLLDKQIVDTRGMSIVRVNDLKLSDTSSSQLRLLGAEVGVRGVLRRISPKLERVVLRICKSLGKVLPERIIAWNYMDLLDRDLSDVKLSVTHKTLDDMHPADIADIIERLDPRLRGRVFAQLDDEHAADAMAEIDDDKAAEIMGDLDETSASRMLSEMDPDDAAELVSELDYDKAEKLLNLMGIKEQKAIRQLLGYRENTAGRIMTSEFVELPENDRVCDAVGTLKGLDEDFETVRYVYLNNEDGQLSGIVSLNDLIVAEKTTRLSDIATKELITASPDDDQEDVAENISKYNLLAMPVVSEKGTLLGIVTVDDALDVLEEEHEEDLQIAGAPHSEGTEERPGHDFIMVLTHETWFFFWFIGIAALTMLYGTSMNVESVILSSLGLPIALLVAEDSVNYATNFFLEYDPDDEEAPSTAGFTFKGVVLGLLTAALSGSIAMGFFNALLSESDSGLQSASIAPVLLGTFGLAAGCIALSFLLSPIYLLVLRHRDKRNLETSGISLTIIAMIVTVVLYVAGFALFIASGLGI